MKHKLGAKLYFKSLNHMPCEVVHVEPFHDAADQHACYTVLLENGYVQTVPVAIADKLLTDQKPKPILQKVLRPGGFIRSVFGGGKQKAGNPALLVLLCSVFAFQNISAQNGDPVTDTSYITLQGGQFFEVKMQTFQDGSSINTQTLIGDSTALVQATEARIVSKAATLAVDARYVSQSRKTLTGLIREDNAVETATGVSPLKNIVAQYSGAFLESGWKIKETGAAVDIAFSVNGAGNLRYTPDGGTTRTAILFGDAIRLRNWSGTNDLDLYQLKAGGAWINLDRTVVLRPPGNADPVSRPPAPLRRGRPRAKASE